MLKNILILFSFCCAAVHMVPTSKPILLQLTLEQIRNTFDNIMTDDYIDTLAKQFAAKAAKYFTKEMKKQRSAIIGKIHESYGSPNVDSTSSNQENKQKTLENSQKVHATALKQGPSKQKGQLQEAKEPLKEEYESNENSPQTQDDKDKNEEDKILMDSREAFNLLREPSPDGDHLDSRSGEMLSGETRDKIPVIEVMKINGSYFRRLLGLI
ncbi:hypothetical protein SFRURICE_007056 [Spodoptera frugiperda]|nr:hypothetical protein SFRURICE_007056 [Spodoptera frugiperda]